MADQDRSKFLLSSEALPKVEIPEALEHARREFRLPEALARGGTSEKSSPTPETEAATVEGSTPSSAAAELDEGGDTESVDKGGDAATSAAKGDAATGAAKGDAAQIAAKGDAAESAASGPSARGPGRKRPDSTLRFKEPTLGWFRAGDDLAEEEESDDYEPSARKRGPVYFVAAAVLVVLVVLVALAIWHLNVALAIWQLGR